MRPDGNRRCVATGEVFRAALLPSATFGRLDGHLAWRQHDGGHESRSNLSHFIAWANRLIGHAVPAKKTE